MRHSATDNETFYSECQNTKEPQRHSVTAHSIQHPLFTKYCSGFDCCGVRMANTVYSSSLSPLTVPRTVLLYVPVQHAWYAFCTVDYSTLVRYSTLYGLFASALSSFWLYIRYRFYVGQSSATNIPLHQRNSPATDENETNDVTTILTLL